MYPHFGLRTAQYTLARFYGPKNFWELYDLKKDPQNLNNVYQDPAYAGIIKDLKLKLKQQIINVKDDEALKLLEAAP